MNSKKCGKVIEMLFYSFTLSLKYSLRFFVLIFGAASERTSTETSGGHSNSSSGIIHCHVYTEISQNICSRKFGLKSWKSLGPHAYEP